MTDRIVKRILVTGSRDWDDRAAIVNAIAEALYDVASNSVGPCNGIIVHGAARGADSIAASIAGEWGVPTEPHPADWGRLGRSAGYIRNQHMVDLGADVCLAFAKAWASGTGHCARVARRAGIPVIDYGVPTGLDGKPS